MNVDRRDFCRMLGVGTLAIGTAGGLGGCCGAVRSRLAEHDPIAGHRPASLDAPTAELLTLASLAPSGHNAQPWRVRIPEAGRLVIGSDKKRWLPAVDPGNRELMLSLGAFLENLVVAAGAAGFAVDYKVIARERTDPDILDVRLRQTAPSGASTDAIRQRRVIRGPMLTDDLSEADVGALAKSTGGRLAYFSRDSAQGRYLRDGTLEANRVQVNRRPAMEELADWIRWSDSDARAHRDGLTPASLEITGLAGWYVRHFMGRNSVLAPSFGARTLESVRRQVGACGGWLVLTSGDARIPTLIETGRVFEKMFMEVRSRMIAIQPMTQMLEEQPFSAQAAAELKLPGEVQFILRTGYLKSYPPPVSLRLPVEWFVQP